MNEREAIRRLKQGDIGGLALLVERYQVQAIRTAYLITYNASLAEDIVQDAFLHLYGHVDSFDEQRPFAPWFLRSVAHAAVRAAQKEQRYISVEYETNNGDMGSNESNAAELPSAAEFEPETALEAAETEDMIEKAMQKLSADMRAALVLRYYLNLSDEEISARLNCAPATVRWRLHSARKQLRVLLQHLLVMLLIGWG